MNDLGLTLDRSGLLREAASSAKRRRQSVLMFSPGSSKDVEGVIGGDKTCASSLCSSLEQSELSVDDEVWTTLHHRYDSVDALTDALYDWWSLGSYATLLVDYGRVSRAAMLAL